MTDNIPALIAEARAFADRNNGLNWPGRIRELADALEAEHKRVESLEQNRSAWIGDAMEVSAERDRYRDAIQDAYNAWHMESRQAAIDILARALDENGAE